MSLTIAILTRGGDCPGMNAVIRAVVPSAVLHHGWRVLGVENGFDELLGTAEALEIGAGR
jgi:6-phosphofructokinase 1